MKKRTLSPIKRLTTLTGSTLGIAVLALFGFGSTFVLMSGQARADCIYIENQQTSGDVAGNGVNKPITLVNGPGNCFTITHSGTYQGMTWHMYQNGSGHCLWVNPSASALEVGGACANDNSHPNEEIVGWGYQNGGWLIDSVADYAEGNGGGTLLAPWQGCGGYGQTVQEVVFTDCGRWLFP